MAISMTGQHVIETDRLVLRHWRDGDLDEFARMSLDTRVMEFFPTIQDRQTCVETIAWITDCIDQNGFGFLVAEIKGGAPFIGFVGLSVPSFTTSFTPCVEVGWRLATEYWGKGYASEAARASLQYGFDHVGLEEIVSFCVAKNYRSRAVMERVGMKRDEANDFDHPSLEENSPLRQHVLYRINKDKFKCNRDP